MPPIEHDGLHPKTAVPLLLASGRELSKSTLFYLLQFAGWIAFGAIWFASDIAKKGPSAAALENLAWITCGSAVTFGLRAVYRRVRATPRSYARYGLVCLAFSILAALVFYDAGEVQIRLCYLVVLSHSASPSPLFVAAAHADALAPWWSPFNYWIFNSIIFFTWSSLYFGINAMLDLETERANVARALKLADSAHLRALQSNLNPHFLFNALNGIATLIRESDISGASAMVEALSVFLRSTLQRLNSPEIQVGEELQLIEQYLRIQRFRFGDRLRSTVAADPDALDALIPTLILQPLVENAVRHGILPREDGGSLWVSIHRDAQTLVVSVEDDGPGLTQDLASSVGVGLRNSRDRLSALYGSAAQLTVGPRAEGGGFVVAIRMPFCRALDAPSPDPAEALPA
jgi:two-component system LytT family sensor kinase